MDGKITIVRSHSNRSEEPWIEITIEDEDSSTRFVTAKMSLTNFAEAITGLACTDCDLEIRGLERVGKKMEMKHARIPKVSYGATEEEIKKVKEPFEKDGWVVFDYPYRNHHYCKDGLVNSTLRRWV